MNTSIHPLSCLIGILFWGLSSSCLDAPTPPAPDAGSTDQPAITDAGVEHDAGVPHDAGPTPTTDFALCAPGDPQFADRVAKACSYEQKEADCPTTRPTAGDPCGAADRRECSYCLPPGPGPSTDLWVCEEAFGWQPFALLCNVTGT